MDGDLNLDPASATAIRVQVQTESGEWLTVVQIPHYGTDDDGARVEHPYWRPFVAGINRTLNESPPFPSPS